MLKPHPSLLLRAYIDERLFNEQLVDSLKRTYSYAATMMVEPLAVDPALLEAFQAQQAQRAEEEAAADAAVPGVASGEGAPLAVGEADLDSEPKPQSADAGEAVPEDSSDTPGLDDDDEIAPPGESPVDDQQNVLVYEVRLHRPYWDENDPDAAEQWDAVMPKWLHNMFYKVSSTQTGYNTMCGEHDSYPLRFMTTEVRFGDNCTFSFKTGDDWVLGDGHVSFIEQGRHAVCSGALGEGVVRIVSKGEGVPWTVEYADGSARCYDPQTGALAEIAQDRGADVDEAGADGAAAAEAPEPGDASDGGTR